MLMAVMELDHVEAFVAIVRRGGFTRASTSLHLSQPAISRRVHLLERELGAPLFERIRGGAVLTEAGRALLPHAEALLASMRDGIAAVRALRGADTHRGRHARKHLAHRASPPLSRHLPGQRPARAHRPQPRGERAGPAWRRHPWPPLRRRSPS